MATNALNSKIESTAQDLFRKAYHEICVDNDRVFSLLLILQWIGAVVVALVVSPRTWIGEADQVHIHVLAALVIGGLLTIVPVYLNWSQPGAVINRYVNVIAQGLYSALLIHLTGGRVETHFHVFGSLAFFAFYRDIRVLLVGTLIVAVDHALRGIFIPQSVFGVFTESNWRWVEHACWVLFEDFFLGYTCWRGIIEMKAIAHSRAEILAQYEFAEILVQERTAELREERNELQKKNGTIATIYTNVKSGFLIVNSELTIQEGFTRSCVGLLGSGVKAGENLARLLGMNTRAADHFQIMVEQVFEDVLPEEVSLSEIPQRYSLGNRVIKLEGGVVRDANGKPTNILFTVNDITDLRRTEIQNASNVTIIKILRQRDAFCQFILDVKESIGECKALAASDPGQVRLRFVLHSIKGNASIFGLDQIVEVIHEIEDKVIVSLQDVQGVEDEFKAFLRANGELLDLQYDGEYEETYLVTQRMLDRLGSDMILEVSRWIQEVRLKSAGEMLSPLASMGRSIAKRLEKSIEIRIEDPDLLVDGDLLRPVVQSLTHLIRNSIDHGVERPLLRGTKAARGLVAISVQKSDAAWTILVRDDGAGIDLDRVCDTAIRKGFVTAEDVERMTTKERLELIFRDGLSTSKSVSHISGRGVGMSAVVDAVKRVGGHLAIESSFGAGTTFTITVPLRPQPFQDSASRLTA